MDHDLRLTSLAFVPEVRLYLFDPATGLFDPSGGEYRSEAPPPFWGFAWAGGQALARYVLDHPETVRDRSVLDLASGSGLVAVAAAIAGARHVTAVDVDALAVAAITDNARANGVEVDAVARDILREPVSDVDIVLAGDAFYSQAMASRVDGFLRRTARGGVRVLVGDPDRGFLPDKALAPLVTYDIPVSAAAEGVSSQRTTVFEVETPAQRQT